MWLLHHSLHENARQYPDKTAIICRDERLSYGEFEKRANALGHGLLQQGVKRGDRVLIWHTNSIQTCISIFGALKAGAAFVVVNPSTKKGKLLRIVKDCRPAVIVTSDKKYCQITDALWSVVKNVQVITVGDKTWSDPRVVPYHVHMTSQPDTCPAVTCIDRDLAALIYTSGSTGVPKGVMCAHYNMVAAATSITHYLQNVPDDIVINVLPLAFDYGLYQLLMMVRCGGTLVLEPSFAFPVKILELMRRERVTGLPGIPSLFSLLLQLDPKHLHLPDLRYITNTGAALPVKHIKQMRDIFGDRVRIYSMYGQTECKRTLFLPPDEIDRRPGSVGIPIPNEEVFVINQDGNEAAPGEIGELVVRGANVMLGYWEKPEETARTFVPGPLPGERLLRTGDLFWRDADRFLYFVSRTDTIIKSRGQKVSPKEVEDVLYLLEELCEAVVVGIDHEVWGEAVQAHVVVEPQTTLDETTIIKHCRRHLESFMVPERIIFHQQLPKTASGKIDRMMLQKHTDKTA